MANALAIAAVSAVLKDVINNGIVSAQLSSEVDVRVGAPPANGNGSNNQGNQINLFLYQVTPNTGWRNEGLPRYNSQGDRITNQPLALDLHYLLTAYGSEEFESETLLGYAMQLLHENTILGSKAIRRSLSGGTEERVRVLATAGLEDQVERIKIIPEYLDTEVMSRLWSSLQANYRMSTAYHVSVVLIEREESTQNAPPVLNRRVFAFPVKAPFIEQVVPQRLGVGQTLTLQGQGLKGTPTQVNFGNEAIAPITVANPQDKTLEVSLPDGLRAGVNTVQVLHSFDLKTPVEPHRGVESNVAAFVLQPTIQPVSEAPDSAADLTFLRDEAAFNAAFSEGERSRFTQSIAFPAIRLRLRPTVIGTQKVLLLLNETPIPSYRPARSYSFPRPALLIDETDIPDDLTARTLDLADQRSEVLVFSTPGLLAGDYLTRIRVEGADSPLTRASIENPDDPMPAFTGPVITIESTEGG